MATTRLPAPWVQRRDLPHQCARHDVPSSHWDKRDFYTRTPPWVLLTIFIGVLLFVILALALRTTVKGALPACAQCTRDRRRFLLWVGGAWSGTAVVFAAGIGMGSDVLVLLGVLGLLGAIVVSCLGDRFRVSGSVSKDKLWVELKGVGPEFARIVDEALRAPQQAAAPAAPPQLSPDGHWWWDGTQWVPAGEAATSQG
ncbi:MAG: hypothetical protein QOE05_1531 [Actinomycetota bacterium]|jgi:hypothetical protein|nr:hypothetical protein [Actinomycetota bacterium]